ncbi:hypothetical protein [Geodermatophilus obscurus]|uniref:hypothetical protein n=1 Tax=Geodermatophilus obscurus TaxID=1861 RepID=UPI00140F9A04|nr:hypothetical protein [Geodermatophilus obscurus]
MRIDSRQSVLAPRHEAVAAQVRAAYLTALIRQGSDLRALQEEDPGRAMIIPLLRNERSLRNVDSPGQWFFGSIDGGRVPDRHIHIQPLPRETQSLLIASDGYPALAADLESTERFLMGLLEVDPLLIGDHPQTKGLRAGNESFDDRSMIHVSFID